MSLSCALRAHPAPRSHSVIHFDSHLGTCTRPLLDRAPTEFAPTDTSRPRRMPDSPWLPGEDMPVGHGSYFYYAGEEGLLAPDNANIVRSAPTPPFKLTRSVC